MKFAILLASMALIAYCAPSSTVKPESKVKEAPADGHRHHRRGGFGWGAGFANPIVDRNVCDLDASVLVVVEGGRRGYNKARRVKCADVAAADEDSCMICCQNAARRDTSVRNEDIFGFLTVIDHFEKDSRGSWSEESHDDDYGRRNKRETEEETASTSNIKAPHDPLEAFVPIKNFRNLKCLCCAPRRQLPPPPMVPIYPQYQQYTQQVISAAPSSSYGSAPVASRYQQPSQTQAVYTAPAAATSY